MVRAVRLYAMPRRESGPATRKADYARWMTHLSLRKAVAQEKGHPYFEHNAFRVKRGLIKSLRGITERLEERFHGGYRLPSGPSGGAGRAGGSDVHFDLAYGFTFREEFKTDMGRAAAKALTDTLGYKFVQAETAAMCGGWGTAADAVFKTPSGEVVVVEWKTGMGHAFTGHRLREDVRMSEPLQDYLACPAHFALLQALATAMMIKHTYGIDCGARVVNVAGDLVSVFGDRDEAKVRDFKRALAQFFSLENTRGPDELQRPQKRPQKGKRRMSKSPANRARPVKRARPSAD